MRDSMSRGRAIAVEVMRIGRAQGGTVQQHRKTVLLDRVRELVSLYGDAAQAPLTFFVIAIPRGALAYRVVGADLEATDLTYGDLRTASERFASALAESRCISRRSGGHVDGQEHRISRDADGDLASRRRARATVHRLCAVCDCAAIDGKRCESRRMRREPAGQTCARRGYSRRCAMADHHHGSRSPRAADCAPLRRPACRP